MEGIQLDDHNPNSDVGRVHSNYFIDEPPVYESPPDYEAPPNYDEAIKMYLIKHNDVSIKTGLADLESNGKFSCYCIKLI